VVRRARDQRQLQDELFDPVVARVLSDLDEPALLEHAIEATLLLAAYACSGRASTMPNRQGDTDSHEPAIGTVGSPLERMWPWATGR
jgi:hypothetical protein